MAFIQVANAVALYAPDVRTAVVGAADSVLALTDANNATYVEAAVPGTTPDYRITHYINASGLGGGVPGNSEIQKIRFGMNYQVSANNTVKVTVEIFYMDFAVSSERTLNNFRAIQTLSLSSPTAVFAATDWVYYLQDVSRPSATGMPLPVQADQLGYRVTVDLSIPGSTAYANFRILDCNLNVYWTGIPSVTPLIGDTTNLQWQSAPVIQVIRNQPFAMQAAQAKIFDLATITDETFDPDTTTPLWDSGEILANTNETSESLWVYPDNPVLPMGKLQVYARASRRAGVPTAPQRWGPWASYDPIPFANQWGSPRAPKVTLTNEMVASSRVKLDIAGQDNLLNNVQCIGEHADNSFGYIELNANTVYDFAGTGLGKNAVISGRTHRLGRSASTGATGLTTRGIGNLGIPVTAGRTYALAMYAWMNSGLTRNQSFLIDWYNSAGTFLSTTTTGTTAIAASPTTAPTLCTQTVTAPASSAYARFGFQIAGVLTTETAFADGMTFRPYDNADSNIPSIGGCAFGNKIGHFGDTIFSAAPTQLTYGENGVFGAATAAGHTGTNADKFTRDTVVNRACWWTVPNFQDRVTELIGTDSWRAYPFSVGQFAPTTFTASVWSKAVTTTRDMRLGVVWFDELGTVLQIAWGSTVNVTTAAYVKLTATGTGPREAAYVGLRCVIDDGAASEVFLFDDFMLGAGSTVAERMESSGPQNFMQPDCFVSFVQVQRRINGGPWQDLEWMTTQYEIRQQVSALYDYSAPYGSTIDYRARTVAPSGEVRVRYGEWSPIVTVSPALLAVGGRWKIKDVLDPTRNLDVDFFSDRGFEWSRSEDLAVFDPFGRPTPIVVSDVVRSRTISLQADFVNLTEWAAFLVLANSQRTLLLQRPWTGEQWWVRITSNVHIIEQNTSPVRITAEFELREVDVPSVS